MLDPNKKYRVQFYKSFEFAFMIGFWYRETKEDYLFQKEFMLIKYEIWVPFCKITFEITYEELLKVFHHGDKLITDEEYCKIQSQTAL